ncbi:MAG: ribosome-associated translation inhibitor RaiA [Armatimonadetes bacterium]|nr:ribosome-associated translation inhibitor RaiA [Armatimonadota bacterium]
MELLVRNAEGNLTQDDRDYAAKKLGKLDRYFHAAKKVELVHRKVRLDHRIEVTVFADGFTLRGEESNGSVRAAIDKVAGKLENRLRRLKTKLIKSHRHKGTAVPPALVEVPEEQDQVEPTVTERKRIALKPMSVEEASLQMELVDHPFFMFRNAETDQTEVLYKRDDGHYGLLSPEP